MDCCKPVAVVQSSLITTLLLSFKGCQARLLVLLLSEDGNLLFPIITNRMLCKGQRTFVGVASLPVIISEF